MEDTLRELKKELERKTRQYEQQMNWVKSGMEKLSPEEYINTYHTLQMNLSELATLAAEIQMIQDHISMVETYS